MARRKSAELHALTGTGRRGRTYERLPEVGGIGEPPDGLPVEMVATWKELGEAMPGGIATPADRAAFEVLVRTMTRIRAGAGGAADAAQARLLLEAFAMTPNSARRAMMAPPAPPNKLERFLADAPTPRPRKGLSAFVDD